MKHPVTVLLPFKDTNWSVVMTEAKTFGTLDDADDYVRVNFREGDRSTCFASIMVRN